MIYIYIRKLYIIKEIHFLILYVHVCICASYRQLLYIPATTVSFRIVTMGNSMEFPGNSLRSKGHVEKIVVEGIPLVFRLIRVLFQKAWKHLGQLDQLESLGELCNPT